MAVANVIPLLDLGDLPFHVRIADEPSNGEFPDVLPFVVGVEAEAGLLVQSPDPSVAAYLDAVYRRGLAIGCPMAESGFGRAYADDFLRFIARLVMPGRIEGQRVLEIGCGDGYLLSRLQNMSARVVGIEPGEHGQEGSRRYGVPIVRGAFPAEAPATAGPFDVILHYAVLEHLTDPAAFLRAQVPRLATTGKIIFAVPDCSAYVAHGDIGMFVHEHWSYFTPQSLRALVEQVGLRLAQVERSGFGGALYAVAEVRAAATPSVERTWEMQEFAARVRRGIDGARAFFAAAKRLRRSVGVFAPGRFINYLHVAQPAQLPRLFDDEPNLQGKYYPPFDRVVESRAALLAEPVDELIIASRSFGDRLRDELSQAKELSETRIWLLDDVLNCASSGLAL